MKNIFFLNENIQQEVDQLVDSFRSSFWIDEHQWFARCFARDKTIHFSTLSDTFCYDERKLPDFWRSTYPHDNQQNLYDNITTIYDETFFDQSIPFDMSFPNIHSLHIKLPIHNKFWSTISNFNRLYSLTVSSHIDTFQSQLQTLLDRAPRLRFLQINQNESLSLQISIFQYTSKSVRVLDLRNCNYSFNEEECMKLCHSPLGIQCKILSINVKNRESINIFVKYMTNLRALHITCEDEMFNKRSTSEENANDEFCDENIDNSDELIRWLEDHLPSTCLVGRDPHSHSFIRIWL
ncbi:unnamed protein product [Rotaria sp. Silwood1]|nr:unnamed protein product [Rotaria sp. Silwood1]CAF3630700.1 unnamed protein product [Rotaria sp. Silwood1]CAF4854276.1 unnamed protein product [Rotaria sp. Silwood1]CAF4912596.1 unnamed protein product [Rotaria sp. Silwood1]